MSGRNEETLSATRPRSRKSLSAISNSISDKENMTTDLGSLGIHKRAPLGERPAKKSRSKSIGPGGLDALSSEAGSQRESIIPSTPRSILKPTMPPLREIPSHSSLRKASPKKTKSTSPPKSKNLTHDAGDSAFDIASEDLPNQFAIKSGAALSDTRVSLRTEEEQQQAVRAREAKESKAMEKDINARRDARRKSLANRRVSFAPEATLHTWDVVEYMQDFTASSSATNSTRRASAASNDIDSVEPASLGSDSSEQPSTPTVQVDAAGTDLPEHQRDLHQKKRRRSSGIPPLNFNNPDDEFLSSSPLSGSSGMDEDEANAEFDDDENSNSDSDLDDDGTVMSLDGGDTTNMSLASGKSVSSSGSSVRLEEALRLAARQAGTQGIDFDEHGDTGVDEEEEEEEELISFTPWSKNGSLIQDKENLNPFSPAFKAGVPENVAAESDEEDTGMDMDMDMTKAVGRILPFKEKEDEDEMTMDITVAMGGIIPKQPLGNTQRRRSVASRRQSTHQQSLGPGSDSGDDTMDLTMAMGSIHQPFNGVQEVQDGSKDEGLTMEFTSAIGGVLPPGAQSTANHGAVVSYPQLETSPLTSVSSVGNSSPMEMTTALGTLLSSKDVRLAKEEEDETFGMDITAAVGKILHSTQPDTRSEAKHLMEEEADSAEPGSSPFRSTTNRESSKLAHTVATASETGSPTLAAFKARGLRRNAEAKPLADKNVSATSPFEEPSTPTEQRTPQPRQPTTPSNSTPLKSTKKLVASPKHVTVDSATSQSTRSRRSINATQNRPGSVNKPTTTPNKLFQKDMKTGASTPHVILTPSTRRSSGFGIDKDGLGSPRLAAILDRRSSIGEASQLFSPGQFVLAGPGVRFDVSERMESEIDKYREEEESREDGRKIMEREADGGDIDRDATIVLKEMIQSLSPKKKPMKGRKSLHVGAATGLLGKRPVELESEDEDTMGIKRLKNHQGSPVKNVKLQAPPTKEETTGRLTRSTRRSLDPTNMINTTPVVDVSPPKISAFGSPKARGKFKDTLKQASPQKPLAFVEIEAIENAETVLDELVEEEPPMHLQEFLNMTSIRFMELNPTKRRHTIASKEFPADGHEIKDISLEDCVVSGACIVPMLELFQHSCRELKKYISEGRSVVREIETETFEENPPLFREYMSAAPDVRTMMDTQFKNVKTHARLTSKGQWYDWRMKLLDGLKAGLHKMTDEMRDDAEVLRHRLDLLQSVVPSLVKQYEQSVQAEAELQMMASEMAGCDQENLQRSRNELVTLDDGVESKKRKIAEMQAHLYEKESLLQKSVERRQVCFDDIREAEKTREECRGWTATEVQALKSKADDLEKDYGWMVTGVSDSTVSMAYRSELELVFDVSSFKSKNLTSSSPANPKDSRIDLWYIGNNRTSKPSPLSTEREFFLENIRDHIRGLPQRDTSIKTLLNTVSASWKRALDIDDQIHALRIDLPTQTAKTSDNSITVKAALLLPPIATMVSFTFHLVAISGPSGLDIDVTPKVSVVYGSGFNEDKLSEFMLKRVSGDQGLGGRSWSVAVLELEEKLLTRTSRK